jgi:retron-type reverse transcriptase
MKLQVVGFIAPLSSAAANGTTNSGLAIVNANNSATNANTNIRLQLSFLPSSKPCPLAKNKSTHTSFGSVSEEDGNLKQKMKRVNNLFDQIVSYDNLVIAEKKARKGKLRTRGVVLFDRDPETKLKKLNEILLSGKYHTSEYHTFKMITDNGKEREIFRLPYYPDRIVHHAIMNVMEDIWVNTMTSNTYSCIKKRGIHKAATDVKETLTKYPELKYCLKLDIKKYYPTIDHDILKAIIRKKVKDKKLLILLDEIIESTSGVPIGNYLSQYFANLYLTYFDHWLKEEKKVTHYYRYADDMVILHQSKEYLNNIFNDIQTYLKANLKLKVKENHQVFPIAARGIDFVGYVFYPSHTRLRKSIKKRFAKAVTQHKTDLRTTHSAYYGWAKHCNCINLIKKLAS